MSDLIVGRHAALEAMRAGRRRLIRLWIEGKEGDRLSGIPAEILSIAQAQGVPVRFIRGGLFDKLAHEQANAQGIALETGDYPYVDVEECLRYARALRESPLLLILDHLQDPQNLGALFRTAEAMGVHGVILPERRSARVTPSVSNSSAGAVEHLLVAQTPNISRIIAELKADNVWVAGLDDGPDAQHIDDVDLSGALALVVGAEGEGLSRLARESCDFLVRIPTLGRVESLNAAVAGSIVLYAARSARYRS